MATGDLTQADLDALIEAGVIEVVVQEGGRTEYRVTCPRLFWAKQAYEPESELE